MTLNLLLTEKTADFILNISTILAVEKLSIPRSETILSSMS
jgi:hypothetical protein